MSAGGVGTASGAGAFTRTGGDPLQNYATVTGLPGVAYVQDGAYLDSGFNVVSYPGADVELVKLRSGRTGSVRYVTLAALKTLLA